MSKIGIRKVFFGTWTADDTYTGGKQMSTVAGFNGTPNNSDVSDYGDDRAVETDKSISSIGLSIEYNELTLEEKAAMFGHTVDSQTNEMVVSSNDAAPYIGIGAIGVSLRNGVKKYVVKFYHKAQFSEPNDENATKAESTTFGHETAEGTAIPQENGKIKTVAEFDTEAEAVTKMKALLGITP